MASATLSNGTVITANTPGVSLSDIAQSIINSTASSPSDVSAAYNFLGSSGAAYMPTPATSSLQSTLDSLYAKLGLKPSQTQTDVTNSIQNLGSTTNPAVSSVSDFLGKWGLSAISIVIGIICIAGAIYLYGRK